MYLADDDVICCEADLGTTIFYLKDGKTLTGGETLGYYSELYEIDFNFFRVHHSLSFNLDYLHSYNQHTRVIKLKQAVNLKKMDTSFYSKRRNHCIEVKRGRIKSSSEINVGKIRRETKNNRNMA